MAIDNAEKRKSISGIGLQPWVAPGVTPNVAKDSQWRSQVAWSYSGIVPDPPDPGAPSGSVPEIVCGSLPTAGVGTQIHVGGGGGIN